MRNIDSSEIKKLYPSGTRIVCLHKADDPMSVPNGTTGVIHYVDDIGTIHVEWDNGRRIGLVPGEDEFYKQGD